MANTSTQTKKAAPTVDSILMETDERTALIRKWNEKEPGYAYKFERGNASDASLEKKGYERVGENGNVVNHCGDILVRRAKELDDAVRKKRQGRSLEQVKEKLKDSYRSGYLEQTAKPKNPTKNKVD